MELLSWTIHRAFAVDLATRPIDQPAPEVSDPVLRRFFHLLAGGHPRPNPVVHTAAPAFRRLAQQEPTAIRSAHIVTGRKRLTIIAE